MFYVGIKRDKNPVSDSNSSSVHTLHILTPLHVFFQTHGKKKIQRFSCFLLPLCPQMASATATYGQKESSDQNFDYMFKILIIGNSSVGKTSFLFRYADDSFTPAFVSTVGIDFKVKTIYRNDKRIKLQIWVRDPEMCCFPARKEIKLRRSINKPNNILFLPQHHDLQLVDSVSHSCIVGHVCPNFSLSFHHVSSAFVPSFFCKLLGWICLKIQKKKQSI